MAGKTHSHCDFPVTFLSVAVLFLLSPTAANTAEVTKMTYEQAIQRIPDRKIPKFWAGDVADLSGRFEKLVEGNVRTIAITPGGRPMHMVAFGKKEMDCLLKTKTRILQLPLSP